MPESRSQARPQGGCGPSCQRLAVGKRRNHCNGCHEFFNSDAAFEMHRVGNYTDEDPRRCLTVEEMLERGMALNKDGYWVTRLKEGVTYGDSDLA